jgi:PAS domain S-box-containing protein
MKGFVQSVLGRINNLVLVVDATGQVAYVSPSAQKLLGYSPAELAGDGWWNITVPDDNQRTELRDRIARMASRSQAIAGARHERVFRTRMGDEKWFLWDAVPGPGRTVIGIGQDITERKLAEQELEDRNSELQEMHTNLLDSLEYARRIQEMILPEPEKLSRYVADSFILYKPRNIVSGDFYWFSREGDRLFIAVADCTGHGVPGAMVSMLGVSVLRDVIRKYGVYEPARVLEYLDVEMVRALSREQGPALKDGMDIALAVLDTKDNVLEFSGAFRGLVHIRQQQITEIAGARYPIGQYVEQKEFRTTCIQLQPTDRLYMFSDGITDQFGGESDQKFNRKRLKELLLSVQDMPLTEQCGFIEYALNNWKQGTPQTDDMLMLGVEV